MAPDENGSPTIPASSGLKIPLRMVNAHVSELSRRPRIEPDIPPKETLADRYAYFKFYLKLLLTYYVKKFLSWVLIILLIIVALNGIFWVWVAQLSPEELRDFASCLDAGVVASKREQLIYHLACFWGHF